MKANQNMVEVLLFQHVPTGKLYLPGTLVLPDEKIPIELALEFLESVKACPVWRVAPSTRADVDGRATSRSQCRRR